MRRGDVTLWLTPDAIATWAAAGVGRRSGQLQYSDLAIETALTLSLIFHVPLRQTEGFLTSIFGMLGVDLTAPDHTTLSRRGQHLALALRRARPGTSLHLIARVSSAASPAARHPTSGTIRGTHRASPRTPPATGPARSGMPAAYGAPRRHTMPSAQAVVKRGGGAGRTSVSQSWKVTGHFVRLHLRPRCPGRGDNRRILSENGTPGRIRTCDPRLRRPVV